MKTDVNNKDFFLRLVSKERLRGTRKWPITILYVDLKNFTTEIETTTRTITRQLTYNAFVNLSIKLVKCASL